MIRRFLIGLSSLVVALTMTVPVQALDLQDFYAGSDIEHYDKDAEKLPDCVATSNSSGGSSGGGAVTTNVQQFVDSYGQGAFDVGKRSGIPYEAILGQAILESSYGQSQLTKQANNFFGIKAGSGWTGPTVTMRTAEQDAGGNVYYVDSAFRAYPSPEAGFQGYADFIRGNSRYANALNFQHDPVGYIAAIRQAGYATDVSYVDKVADRIRAVQSYIASKNLLPPSSQVTYDVLAPGSAPAGGSSTGVTCSTAPTASSSAATINGTAFPLLGGKSVVKNPNIFHNGTTDKAGHPYTAFDILADPGTKVGAFMDGKVNFVSNDICNGRLVSIYNAAHDMTISYMHMDLGSNVAINTDVKAGQQVGEVGPPQLACGTPHLHIDAIKGSARLGCNRSSCDAATKAMFIDIGPDLFNTFQALGS